MTWFPALTNRKRWEGWQADGGTDMRQRGLDRARRILEQHRPACLEPRMSAELDRMARSLQAQEIEAVRSGKVQY